MGPVASIEDLFAEEYDRLVVALGVAFEPEAAADAVQEAFIAADRRWGRVSRLEDPAGWVRRVALNRLRSGRRLERRRREILTTLRPTPPDDLTAELIDGSPRWGTQPKSRLVKRVMRALPTTPVWVLRSAVLGGRWTPGPSARGPPSRKNPSLCTACVALALPGGVASEGGLLFADLRRVHCARSPPRRPRPLRLQAGGPAPELRLTWVLLLGFAVTVGGLGRSLSKVSIVDLSEAVLRDFVAEFGDEAPRAAERALRSEITRHRIERSVRGGEDPAHAIAAALASDAGFLAEVERIDGAGELPASDLHARLRRFG